MKKTYIIPTTKVIALNQRQQILAGSVPLSETTTTHQFSREFDDSDDFDGIDF